MFYIINEGTEFNWQDKMYAFKIFPNFYKVMKVTSGSKLYSGKYFLVFFFFRHMCFLMKTWQIHPLLLSYRKCTILRCWKLYTFGLNCIKKLGCTKADPGALWPYDELGADPVTNFGKENMKIILNVHHFFVYTYNNY